MAELVKVIEAQAELSSTDMSISAEVSTNSLLADGSVSNNGIAVEGTVDGSVKFTTGSQEYYQGSYTVTSRPDNDQMLHTADKHLSKDIRVKKIPTFETSNNFGTTFYIASEVN